MYCNDYGTYLVNEHFEQRSLVLALWLAVFSTFLLWWAARKLRAKVIQERKALAKLPDHLLRDIGITRADAFAESNRGADDLPLGRLKQLNS